MKLNFSTSPNDQGDSGNKDDHDDQDDQAYQNYQDLQDQYQNSATLCSPPFKDTRI